MSPINFCLSLKNGGMSWRAIARQLGVTTALSLDWHTQSNDVEDHLRCARPKQHLSLKMKICYDLQDMPPSLVLLHLGTKDD